jgi:hypothetical protein
MFTNIQIDPLTGDVLDAGKGPSSSVGGHPTIEDWENQVLSNLKLKRGILNGRELYQQYGEANKDRLKVAIRALERQKLIAVKGNLEDPLGVFQSVFVQL